MAHLILFALPFSHNRMMCNIPYSSVDGQAKGKERQWMRNQTYGDLDEARLIEGLAGEKAIYRRRGEKEPEV